MHNGGLRGGEPVRQTVLPKFVHQEADRAQIHAVDRLLRAEKLVQRLQHKPVAAQRDNDSGSFFANVVVTLAHGKERGLRIGRVRGNKMKGWEDHRSTACQ